MHGCLYCTQQPDTLLYCGNFHFWILGYQILPRAILDTTLMASHNHTHTKKKDKPELLTETSWVPTVVTTWFLGRKKKKDIAIAHTSQMRHSPFWRYEYSNSKINSTLPFPQVHEDILYLDKKITEAVESHRTLKQHMKCEGNSFLGWNFRITFQSTFKFDFLLTFNWQMCLLSCSLFFVWHRLMHPW